MNLPLIILIAVGLSMDCFAVAVASGFTISHLKIRHALRIAFFFGFFQAMMPVVGWLAGAGVKGIITGVDHWIAFALLVAVGGKMIYESTELSEKKNPVDPLNIGVLIVLSIATSIDALAVGISMSLLNISIIEPAAVIGLIAFLMTLIGVYVGKRFGHFFERFIEAAGGIILIGIGAGILIRHLSQ